MSLQAYGRRGTFGSFAQGVGEGLRNLATIRQIQASQEAGERAEIEQGQKTTVFQQQQEEYKRKNERIYDPSTVVDAIPNLDDEGKKYILDKVAPTLGVRPGQKLSLTEVESITEKAQKDPNVMSALRAHQRRGLTAQIAQMEQEIQGLAATDSPDGGLTATANIKARQAAINEKKAELVRINHEDPAWVRQQELDIKRTKAEKATTPNSVAGLRARYAETKNPAYLEQAEALEAEERKLAGIRGRSGEWSPSDTEKKFNFWKRLYPNLSNEEIEKKVVRENIPSEEKYVLDSLTASRKEGASDKELGEVEKAARTTYRRIVGKESPSPGNPGKPGRFRVVEVKPRGAARGF